MRLCLLEMDQKDCSYRPIGCTTCNASKRRGSAPSTPPTVSDVNHLENEVAASSTLEKVKIFQSMYTYFKWNNSFGEKIQNTMMNSPSRVGSGHVQCSSTYNVEQNVEQNIELIAD